MMKVYLGDLSVEGHIPDHLKLRPDQKTRAIELGFAERTFHAYPSNSFWGAGDNVLQETPKGAALHFYVESWRQTDDWAGEPPTRALRVSLRGCDTAEALRRQATILAALK